jgi:hypothetical protein
MSAVRQCFDTVASFEKAQVDFTERFSSVKSYGLGFAKATAYAATLSIPVAIYALALDALKVCESALKLIGTLREGTFREAGKELCGRVKDVLLDIVYVPACIISILVPVVGFVEAARSNPMVCALSEAGKKADAEAKVKIADKKVDALKAKITAAQTAADAIQDDELKPAANKKVEDLKADLVKAETAQTEAKTDLAAFNPPAQ